MKNEENNNRQSLYTTNNGKRTFSGVINPQYKDDKISLFDHYNVQQIQQPEAPEGINLLLFDIMENYLEVFKTPNKKKRQK